MSRLVKIPNPPLILVRLSNKTDPVTSIGCCSQLLELFKAAKLVDAAASALSVTPEPDITILLTEQFVVVGKETALLSAE